jgi:ferritin
MAIISKDIINELQFRIEQEELSSRIYKAMAVWLDFNGYTGAAKLFNSYASEELVHAGWAYTYLNDLNVMPNVPALSQPQIAFTSLPQIISLAYKHEVDILNQVSSLSKKAKNEGDELTYTLGQKYVSEQQEELGKLQKLLDRLSAFGDGAIALRMLDEEMGA